MVISNATYKLQELLVVFLNVSENDTTKDILIDLQVSEALLTLLDIHTLHRDQKIQILQLLHKLSFKVSQVHFYAKLAKFHATAHADKRVGRNFGFYFFFHAVAET